MFERTISRQMGRIKSRLRTTKTGCKKKTSCLYRIKKALVKSQRSKTGLSCKKILEITKCFPNFIGCFNQETIGKLNILSKPVTFMVYVGKENGHWIAVGLFASSIEIFDPLGFDIFNWPTVPCQFLNFIHANSFNKKLLISSKVQPDSSTLCGFYCLVYITKRLTMSFDKIQSLFKKPSNNDYLLRKLFN